MTKSPFQVTDYSLYSLCAFLNYSEGYKALNDSPICFALSVGNSMLYMFLYPLFYDMP